jgi:hypothetical protein
MYGFCAEKATERAAGWPSAGAGIILVSMADKAPNCLKCLHFRITWIPAFPRACEVFGIQCKNIPSYEVYAATGKHCPSFVLKPGLK